MGSVTLGGEGMGLDSPFRLTIRRGDGFAYAEGANAYILYYTHHVFYANLKCQM